MFAILIYRSVLLSHTRIDGDHMIRYWDKQRN
jgi:hypothetical protein